MVVRNAWPTDTDVDFLTIEWHTHTQILQFAEIVTGSHFPSERYSSIQGFELYGASSSFSLCVGTLAVEMTML